jgi:hypothetical protein
MDRRLLRLYSPKQWEAFRGGFKHDAAIWRRGKLVSDFQHGKGQPAWYSLNHKRRPNLEMVWRKGAIEWRALCRIPAGAERCAARLPASFFDKVRYVAVSLFLRDAYLLAATRGRFLPPPPEPPPSPLRVRLALFLFCGGRRRACPAVLTKK